MIESLLRSQERDIMQRFDDHHNFVSRMQKKFVSETTGLHNRIQSMKNGYSQLAHGLNPSEQGYKALLSMALKLQQSVFEGFRKGLTELKEEMEGMVNDLASHMCQPLLSYVKRLKSEGIISLVRQLQALVEQMERDFIRHIPALLAANDRLLFQLRNSEMKLKLCENELKNAVKSLGVLTKAMEVKENSNITMKDALVKKGEETEELRKRMKTQSKRIFELETDVKEIDAKRSEAKRILCAKEKQISLIKGQKDEALRKWEDIGHRMSVLKVENFQLKQMIENVKFDSARNEDAATVDKKLLQPQLPEEKPDMEEKFGDEFLWEILETRQHVVSCSNPRSASQVVATTPLSDKTKDVQSGTQSKQKSHGELSGIVSPSPWGHQGSVWGSTLKQQGPTTRSCSRRIVEISPNGKLPLPLSRSSPSSLPWNLRILGKRDSPNGILRSTPRQIRS